MPLPHLPEHLSDEVTELPPLTEIDPEATVLVGDWVVGAGGSVNIDGTAHPVLYLSVRGLGHDGEHATYTQVHLAVPVEAVPGLVQDVVEMCAIDQDGVDEEAGDPS